MKEKQCDWTGQVFILNKKVFVFKMADVYKFISSEVFIWKLFLGKIHRKKDCENTFYYTL